MTSKNKNRNYIDKKTLHEHLKRHIQKVRECEEKGIDPPPANDYIGNAIIQMATKYATKWNFNQYTWKDEMIGDGILAAVKAINKYDPDREEENPFGYFNQAIYWSFQARIKLENIKTDNKEEMMKDSLLEFHTDGMHTETFIDRQNLINLMEI